MGRIRTNDGWQPRAGAYTCVLPGWPPRGVRMPVHTVLLNTGSKLEATGTTSSLRFAGPGATKVDAAGRVAWNLSQGPGDFCVQARQDSESERSNQSGTVGCYRVAIYGRVRDSGLLATETQIKISMGRLSDAAAQKKKSMDPKS